MFKFYKGLLPPIKDIAFKLKKVNLYDLGQVSEFSRPIVKTVYHGTESISYLGSKIWDILTEKLTKIEILENFNKGFNTWNPNNCPCRLSKVNIEVVGFLLKLLTWEIKSNP